MDSLSKFVQAPAIQLKIIFNASFLDLLQLESYEDIKEKNDYDELNYNFNGKENTKIM